MIGVRALTWVSRVKKGDSGGVCVCVCVCVGGILISIGGIPVFGFCSMSGLSVLLSVLGVQILPWIFRGVVCGCMCVGDCRYWLFLYSGDGVWGGRVFALIPISLYMVFRFHQGYPGEWSCGVYSLVVCPFWSSLCTVLFGG